MDPWLTWNIQSQKQLNSIGDIVAEIRTNNCVMRLDICTILMKRLSKTIGVVANSAHNDRVRPSGFDWTRFCCGERDAPMRDGE